MNFNITKTILAVAISALLAYSLYVWNTGGNGMLLPFAGFIEFAIILVTALGLKVDGVHTMTNAKIVSWLFFIAATILNIVFARNGVKVSTFIITNGFVLLFFILICYSIIKARKNK